MAYTKTQWVNNEEPSINAENLNKMEQGIADAQSSAQWGSITGQLSEQTDLNNELSTLNSNLSQKVSSVNDIQPDTNGNVSLNAEDILADGVGSKDVSGNPIIITDGVAENAQNLSVDIEPIQDLHGYDHPWAGGAGKNKLKVNATSVTRGGITFTVNDDGSVKIEGTTNSSNVFINMNYVANTLGIPVGTWKIGLLSDDPRISIRGYVTANSVETRAEAFGMDFETVTVPNDATQSHVRVQISITGITINTTVYPMILSSDETDTSWAPYSNICPITGRTSVNVTRSGKNLISFKSLLDTWRSSYTDIGDGSYNVTATGAGYREPFQFASKDIDVTLSGKITQLSGSDGWRLQLLNSNNEAVAVIGIGSTPLSASGKGCKLRLNYTTPGSGANYKNIQVELGSTATAYEPYTGQSVTVNLGQTVYGGMLNVTTGELTVKTANIASYNGETIGEPWWSSMDEYMAGTAPTTGAQVVYTLATPTTVSLTPAQLALLEGYNIISTDGDTLNLRYTGTVASNVQTEIDEFEESTRKLAGSLAMIETSPAMANHAVGDYLMLNNRLCKVTAAIATGEQIIVGSNVQYTTVAEELTAILAQINA